jgi:hypothetical protein
MMNEKEPDVTEVDQITAENSRAVTTSIYP